MLTNQGIRSSTFVKIPISQSIICLKNHFLEIISVRAWAEEMGYENAKSFSDDFRKEFGQRPQPVLITFRVWKIILLLRRATISNYEIAVDFQLQDEKGLYQFIKSQTDYAPTDIQNLPELEYGELLERLEKNIIE